MADDLRLNDPRLQRLYAYLEEKRAGRPFAARADLNPLDFPYMLGNVVLVDVLYEPVRFRYRLVGTGLVPWRNYDLTNKFVHDHPDPEYREFVLARNREVLDQRRAVAGIHRLVMDGKLRHHEALRVPLSADGETIDMILAALVDLPL